MAALAVTAAILLSALGYGLPILRRLGTLPSGALERVLHSVLIGLGVQTMVVLAVGLVGQLSLWFACALVGVGAFIAAYEGRQLRLNTLAGALPRLLRSLYKGGPIVWGCWVFLGVAATLNLLASLAPVSGTDALVYHLAIPKLYAEEGRIRYVPGVYYSTAAFGLEMLFTVAVLLGSPIAAQTLHFVLSLLASLAVYILGLRAFSSPRVGLLGAALFYAITDVSVGSSIAHIDLGATAYLLAAVLAAIRWREQGGNWFIVAGALAGFHAGTKMPNLAAAGALWLMLAIDISVKRELVRYLRPLALSGVIIAVLAAPWFARSWAWTGNPVHPYLHSIFNGRDFSPEASERQLAIQYSKTIGDRTLDRLVLFPLTLTVNPDAFRSGYLGPVYLSVLPFLFLVPLSRSTRLMLLFALVSIPAWYFLYPRLRTLLPVIGALSPAVAAATLSVARLHPVLRALVLIMVVLWLSTAVAANARYHLPAIPVSLGLESEDSYLRRRLPQADSNFVWYDDFMVLNQTLPRDAVVLLWDTRGYYLDRPYIWANSVAQGLIPPERQRDPAELVRALRERGVTHVAMYPGEPPVASDVPIEQLQRRLVDSGALRETYRSATMSLSEVVP